MYNFLKGRLIIVRLCLMAAVLILIAIGIATIYSVDHPAELSPASQTDDSASPWIKRTIFAVITMVRSIIMFNENWKKQIIFAGVAIVGFIAINTINYRQLGSISYWIYALVLLFLGLLLIGRYVVNLPLCQKSMAHTDGLNSTLPVGLCRPSSPRNFASWCTFWPWPGICDTAAITAVLAP